MERRNNGVVLQSAAACAACKHQRKKCHENCPLAPYFPADRNSEFQAVHKVFGVSNVTKMVKNVKEEDRRKAVDSLVWEAICRQNDPVLGAYAEYRKVMEELKVYKLSQNQSQSQILPFAGQVGGGGAYKSAVMPSLGGIGWNSGGSSVNNGNGIMGIINGGGVSGNNLLSYIHDNLSAIIDSSPYSNSSIYNLQSPEKVMRVQQEKEITSSVVVPAVLQQQQQQHHPNFRHCF